MFIEMDVDLEKLKLQEEEVSAVKFVHHKELLEAFKRKDPTYVPCSFDNGYGRLFDVVAAKYK